MCTTDNIYRYSILGVALLLPSPFYEGVLPLLSIAGICWIIQKNYRELPRLLYKKQVLLPAVLYLYIAAGFFFSENSRRALSSLSTMLPLILFPVFIGTSSTITKPFIRRVNIFFLASVIITLLYAVLHNAINIFISGVDNVRVLDSYYHKLSSFGLTSVYHNWHPTYAAVFANMGIVILIHLYFSSKQPPSFVQKSAVFLVFLFLSVCIFLLDSLIGIGTYFVLLLLLIKRGKEFNFLNTPSKRLIAVFILVAGVLVLYINPMGNDKIASLKTKALTITDSQAERNLLTIRLAKWSVYYDIFTTKPLLGTTLGDIGDVRKEKYLEKGFNDLALHNYNAHNQYLEILATLGILGLAVFLMLLFYPLVKKETDTLYAPFLIICLITFCTESLLLRQQGILFFMFFYSVYTHSRLPGISSGRK